MKNISKTTLSAVNPKLISWLDEGNLFDWKVIEFSLCTDSG